MSGQSEIIKRYSGRKFHWRDCNCWELTRAVWREVAGVDLPFDTPQEISASSISLAVGRALNKALDGGLLTECAYTSPALALFTGRHVSPHGGVVLNGLLLHVTPFTHVSHDPVGLVMEKGEFNQVRYFR